MVTTAFVFAGQGAQTVGMGKALFEKHPRARELFGRAGEALGFDLAKACFEGPQETLNRTDICQPALLVHGIAALETCEAKPAAEAAAGLSLGEYTACVFAGALEFETAVRLVKRRGQWMQEACEAVPSGMASILGLRREGVAQACREAGGIVGIANINAPGQIVISGENGALARAVENCKALGAKRAIPLKVAGAYHSLLMKPAQDKMQAELAQATFRAPRVPIVCNVDAKPTMDPERLRRNLSVQITSSVLWEDSIRVIGAQKYYEFGPGRVLAGLIRKIDEKAEVESIE
ncbi:MAG: ACP S-malonyltransferase [Planctomycetes bacterium]|nr:ACP S-malonyltransferase [Planctomycetota bacterium]